MIETEQQAFVLHSRPYRDNQLLVDLLTEHNGKVSALVFVGQSKKSTKKGLLQPFYPLSLVLKGQSSLKHIVRVEAFAKSYSLTKNTLYCGFYLNELLVRLLGEHTHCLPLFHQYQTSLQALANGAPMMEELRRFELVLLEELGMAFDFSPVFEHNVKSFYYMPEQGFIPALMKLKAPCYDSQHLQQIAQQIAEPDFTYKPIVCEQSSKAVQQTFKILMRQIFNHLLDNKPLNARQLFSKQ